jgi:16S rRNA (cytosine1402-N4)-methyltransferase
MLREVLAAIQPQSGEIYVDATFGAGGYSRALLEAADCTVIAIDRDPDVQGFAHALQQEFGNRFCLLMGCFSDMTALLAYHGIAQVQGIVMDIGVSSMQLDQAERGFSFRLQGALDMRQSQQGITAADVVNTYPEAEIADILYRYGEERQSRRIARAILAQRLIKPFETTTELAELIAKTIPSGKHEIHPATRSFQGLRIYINRELEELEKALEASETLLAPAGRLVVVSFHSLEDRIVKQFLKRGTGSLSSGSRHLPDNPITMPPCFMQKVSKAILPQADEIQENPRSRSAKLRWAIRTATAAATPPLPASSLARSSQ